MVGIEIQQLFDNLKNPEKDAGFEFNALHIPSFPSHRIGRDKVGRPAFLLMSSDESPTHFVDFSLEHIIILFQTPCVLNQENIKLTKKFTCVRFIGRDFKLQQYFLRLGTFLLEAIGNLPTIQTIIDEVSKFVELFRLAALPEKKSIQGLWAELFVINISKSVVKLMDAWHASTEEKFDFSLGQEKIEIKSSMTGLRIHNFSIEQLYPPAGTTAVVVSVLVRQQNQGCSVIDLCNKIEKNLTARFDLIQKLRFQIAQTLGSSIHQIDNLTFDYNYSINQIRRYNTDNIPKVQLTNIDPNVSDVRFRSDLTSLQQIDIIPIDVNGLIASL